MSDTRTPLMAGNWKMNLNHQEAVVLTQKLAWTLSDKKHDYGQVEVVVLPPFTDLRSVQTLVDGDQLLVKYGAQDVSVHDSGAYTGEISAGMLAKLGCSYVVVGHSERREHHAETDEVVNGKAHKALDAGMTPIVCVGEGLEVRQAGDHVPYTLAQVDGSLAGFTAEQVAGLVVAYEPVWAIGTGEVATPDDAQEVCAAIRERIREVHGDAAADGVRVLYGGSVKAANVAGIMDGPTSTAVWWAAPVCRPTSSEASAGSTTCRCCDAATRDVGFSTVTLLFTVLLVITSLALILMVLLHKGRGGGLSDMFGGGVSSSLGWLLGRGAQPGPDHRRPRRDLVRLHRRTGPVAGLPELRGAGSWLEVETRFAGAGSVPVPWARPSVARPRRGRPSSTTAHTTTARW